MQPRFRVEEFREGDFARALRSEWDSFERQADRNSPNIHPDYAALWLDILGKSCKPRVITAWSKGELVGYAPFMESRDPSGRLSIPKVRFIGNNNWRVGDYQYADIITRGAQAPVIKVILSYLKASSFVQGWDLGYLPPASPTANMGRAFLRHRYAPSIPSTFVFPVLDLPSDWDTYLKSLSKNARGLFRQGSRRLQEHGEVRVQMERDPETVARRVSEMIRNHDRWWKGTRKEHWFGDDRIRRFFVEGARLLAAHGRYLTFTLELDRAPIAWCVGPADGGRYYNTLTSYDRDFGFGSPGFVLEGLMMRELITHGIHRVEQGPGSERYKFELGGIAVSYHRVQGYPCFPSWFQPGVRLGKFLAFKGLI